ncbi:MAG: right-handed parallel beta-helix repeat-containing protein, partial [Halobacteriales archaeon]|nr:right-handed parallel beta-helix repeat-containing protein [Halobacteriales archaeon]
MRRTLVGVVLFAMAVALGASWVVRSRDRGTPPVISLAEPSIPVHTTTTETEREPPVTGESHAQSDPDPCDLRIDASVSTIGPGQVGPGDLVCLEAGTRGPLDIEGISGTEERPIVFVNDGGVTVVEGDHGDYAGIDLSNSSHLVVTGTGSERRCGAAVEVSEQRCGIVIRGTGRGVAATERSDRISVDHVEISGTSHSGIFIKSGADEGVHRDEWFQSDTRVVDNYVHDVGKEGLYIGSSFYSEGEDPVLVRVDTSRNLIVESG